MTDQWCKGVKCDPVYSNFCSNVKNDNVTPAPTPQPTPKPLPVPEEDVNVGEAICDHVVVGYYISWGIYDRNFLVQDIPANFLTHINYAFANLDEEGNVVAGDLWADTQYVYPDETYPGSGNFGALRRLKKAHPHLKTLISIGGWTWSRNFPAVAASSRKRKSFVKTAISFMLEHGFDGIDIDWEFPVEGGPYPGTPEDSENFVKLLKELRTGLNNIGSKHLLTIATTQNPNRIKFLKLSNITPFVDFINVMTYDYNGPWSTKNPTNHNAPLYENPKDQPLASLFNIYETTLSYEEAGLSPNKLVLGLPFYGYIYGGVEENDSNGLYARWSLKPMGTWASGILIMMISETIIWELETGNIALMKPLKFRIYIQKSQMNLFPLMMIHPFSGKRHM